MRSATVIAQPGYPLVVTPEAQIRAALRENQLRLYYQLIVDLDTGRASGVEALLRWEHPQGGTLPPDDFLPAVAHTPVIHEITRWVLHASLQALAVWPDLTMSVNVSARDVTRPAFVDEVEQALDTAGVAPERLILELTEQAMVENFDAAVMVLSALRQHGVGLSLDDFGTGYSSLLYLRNLPITELKIDRTFLANLPGHEDNRAIVKSVAALGRSIGVRVVAEGIETAAQAQIARSARCTAAQGFLWGEPAPAHQVDPKHFVVLPSPTAFMDAAGAAVADDPVARRTKEMLDQGASLHTIAAALNSEGLRTARDTRWTAPTVARVINSLQQANAATARRPAPEAREAPSTRHTSEGPRPRGSQD